MTWAQYRNDLEFRSSFGAQAVEISPPCWMVTVEATPMNEADSGAWKAFVMQTRGKTNQVSIHDLNRPAPLGTLRGTVTLLNSVSQGATTMTINGGYDAAGKTLVAGDLLGLGTGTTQQLVMVTADASSSSETRSMFLDFANNLYSAGTVGDITITFEPALRNAFTAGAAITWDKPTALFRRKDSQVAWEYSDCLTSGFSMQFIEDWRA